MKYLCFISGILLFIFAIHSCAPISKGEQESLSSMYGFCGVIGLILMLTGIWFHWQERNR